MSGGALQTVLGVIFGAGFAGFVTVLVASYRRLREGKFSDEESLIQRLYREGQRQEKRADEALAAADACRRSEAAWREQAWQYRLQLHDARIEPKDDEKLWPDT